VREIDKTVRFQGPPAPKECLEQSIESIAHALEADSTSLDSMRSALRAAINYLMIRKWENDRRVSHTIPRGLIELSDALAAASQGYAHPALEVRRTRGRCRGYTTVQKCFLDSCRSASDALYVLGKTREEADKQVQRWAQKNAQKLGLALHRKDALKDIRNRLGWCSLPSGILESDPEDERQLLQSLVETFRRQIEQFDGRGAYATCEGYGWN
jgi:hypothetical protein